MSYARPQDTYMHGNQSGYAAGGGGGYTDEPDHNAANMYAQPAQNQSGYYYSQGGGGAYPQNTYGTTPAKEYADSPAWEQPPNAGEFSLFDPSLLERSQ